MLIVKAEISSLPVLKHNFENMSQEKKRPEKSWYRLNKPDFKNKNQNFGFSNFAFATFKSGKRSQ